MLSIKIHTGKGYLFSNTIKQNKIQCSLQKNKKECLIMGGWPSPGREGNFRGREEETSKLPSRGQCKAKHSCVSVCIRLDKARVRHWRLGLVVTIWTVRKKTTLLSYLHWKESGLFSAQNFLSDLGFFSIESFPRDHEERFIYGWCILKYLPFKWWVSWMYFVSQYTSYIFPVPFGLILLLYTLSHILSFIVFQNG